MRLKSVKLVVCVALLLVVGLPGTFVLIYKDAFFEEWYLRKLNSEDPEERLGALEKLVEWRSRKVIPILIRLAIGQDELNKEALTALREYQFVAMPATIRFFLNEDEVYSDRWNSMVLMVNHLQGFNYPALVPTLIDAQHDVTDDQAKQLFVTALADLLPKIKDVSPGTLVNEVGELNSDLRAALLGHLNPGSDPGTPGPDVVGALIIHALGDENNEVRQSAFWALSYSNLPVKKIVPHFIRGLDDSSPDVRWVSAESLGKLGAEALDAATKLRETLGDSRVEVSTVAAQALKNISLLALLDALEDENERVRELVVITLEGLRSPEVLAAILERVRRDGSELVRVSAINFLDGVGAEAGAAVPALLEALQSDSDEVRYSSARALGSVGRDHSDSVIPALSKAFRDEDLVMRRNAAHALSELASDSVYAILREGLVDPDLTDAIALGLARQGAAGVGELTRALSHESDEVRLAAARALGMIGPEAAASIPTLCGLLVGERVRIRLAVIQALEEIDQPRPEAIEALTGALPDREVAVRLSAALCLVKLHPESAALTVPVFVEVLKSRSFHHANRLEILQTIERLGKVGVPILVEALGDDVGWIRVQAANQLEKLGPEATEAVPVLKERLDDPDESVREAAARALKTAEESSNRNSSM